MLKTRLAQTDLGLTPKEKKIRRALLANYPLAGLSTVADLAVSAGVSVPTVLRFVSKLGYPGYSAFQKSLIDEVGDTLNSPLSLLHDRKGDEHATLYPKTMHTLSTALDQVGEQFVEDDFEHVVDLITDERSRIHCLGGRFSAVLAERLALHLAQVRPGVTFIGQGSSQMADGLVDYNSQVTLIVFDFRRYQDNTIRYASIAAKKKAKIVLFTDRWQSPISAFATRVLTSPVESGTLFDSWVPAIAQTEALVAASADRNPDRVRERLSAIEAVREEFAKSWNDGQ